MHYNVRDEITYPFQTPTVAPLKFGKVLVISSHNLLDVWLLIHAGIKINPC